MIYEYTAAITRCVDGDTVELDVDLGFHIRHHITGRLDGINAPELRTTEGTAARFALAGMVLGKTLKIHTVKDRTEKYGRMLVTIFLEDGVTTANQLMIDTGNAVLYDGGKRT